MRTKDEFTLFEFARAFPELIAEVMDLMEEFVNEVRIADWRASAYECP